MTLSGGPDEVVVCDPNSTPFGPESYLGGNGGRRLDLDGPDRHAMGLPRGNLRELGGSGGPGRGRWSQRDPGLARGERFLAGPLRSPSFREPGGVNAPGRLHPHEPPRRTLHRLRRPLGVRDPGGGRGLRRGSQLRKGRREPGAPAPGLAPGGDRRAKGRLLRLPAGDALLGLRYLRGRLAHPGQPGIP